VPARVESWTVGTAAIVSAGLASALILGWIRLEGPRWLLGAIGCAPVVLFALPPDHRLISFHGFLHQSIAYRILEGGVPPFDPLFAETPLLYPWAHHLLVAGLCEATNVSPASLFAVLNLVLLAGTLATVHAIASTLFRDRTTSLLAAALSLYALAALPIAWLLAAFPSIELESRLIPIQKFVSTNSNSFGFLFYALGLLALVRLADRQSLRRGLALLFGAVLGAAVFYPLVWAPLVALATVCALLLARGSGTRSAAIGVIVCTALASLVALPYLVSVQIGKSPSATIGFEWSIAHGIRNGANLLLVVFGWLLLLAFDLPALRRMARERPAVVGVVAAAAIVPAAMFWPLHAAVHSEYKFLALAGFTLAIPSAQVIRKLHDRSLLLCFLLLALLFLPAGGFFAQLARYDFRHGATAVQERGPLIVPDDPHESALARWIRSETSPDAVFVDSELTIPPFAHRQLYVAMEPATARQLAGWGLSPTTLLADVIGHPLDEIDRRRKVTRALLGAHGLDDALVGLRRDIFAGELYLVSRSPIASGRLAQRSELERVFGIGPIRVFRVATVP